MLFGSTSKYWFEKLNLNVRFWLNRKKKYKNFNWVKEEIHIALNQSHLHHYSCCLSAAIRGLAVSAAKSLAAVCIIILHNFRVSFYPCRLALQSSLSLPVSFMTSELLYILTQIQIVDKEFIM